MEPAGKSSVPSLTILPHLQKKGASLKAYDPAAMTAAQPALPAARKPAPGWSSRVELYVGLASLVVLAAAMWLIARRRAR